MKKATTLLLILFTLFALILDVSAQVTVYHEDFSLPNNTTVDAGLTPWTLSLSTDVNRISVQGNVLRARNLDQVVTWTSGIIDISGYSTVDLKANISQNDATQHEAADIAEFYYILDGAPPVAYANSGLLSGPFIAASPSHSGLSGSTLQILIRLNCNNSNEIFFIDDIQVFGNQSIQITSSIPSCIDVSSSSFSLNVDYDANGLTFNAGNTFTVELSDATGSFATPSVIGSLSSTSATGTIPTSIPIGTLNSSNYLIRVTSSDPVLNGISNGTPIQIFSVAPSLTVTPPGAQTINAITMGTMLTATSSAFTSGNLLWGYRTIPGGPINYISGQTTNTYTPEYWHFPSIGTYYVVCVTQKCSSLLYNVISNEVPIQVTAVPNSISGTVFLDINTNGIMDFSETGQGAVRVELYHDLNSNGVIDAGEPIVDTKLTNAVGGYMFQGILNTVSRRVSSSSDDAEQNLSTNAVSLNSTDLEMVTDANDQLTGVRFTNIPLNAGDVVSFAYIEFETDETNNEVTNLNIYGQANVNPTTFTTTASNLSTRPSTTASVAWNNVPAWNTVGQLHQTPDLSTILQEIIGMPGWTSGNAMSFFINGTGKRVAKSFDLNAATAPRLVYGTLTPAQYIVKVVTADLGGGTLTAPALGEIVVPNVDFVAGVGNANFGYYGETIACFGFADGGDGLHLMNRFTGQNMYIGPAGVSDIEAIATNVFLNRIFATNGGVLGELNRLTGAFMPLGPAGTANGSLGAINLTDIDGLTIDPFRGILFGSQRRGSNDIIFTLDMNTGSVVPNYFGAGIDYVPITGAGIGLDIDDFMINPFSGNMYAANSNGGTYPSQLIQIQYTGPSAGTATLIGSFDNGTGSLNYDIEGIGSSDCGQIYVTSGDGAGTRSNSLYFVDETTGATTLVQAFNSQSDFEGADCLFAPANRILGNIFDDVNVNGILDAGETGLASVYLQLFLDVNNNNIVDAGDHLLQTTVSDGNGDYYFTVAGVIGNFVVQVQSSSYPAGYTSTTPEESELSYPACTMGGYFLDHNFGAHIIILPTRLEKFTVENHTEEVKVKWEILLATESATFEVQRSSGVDPIDGFTTIGSVESKRQKNSYGYYDESPLSGTSYYRLKVIENNGTSYYSKIVSVNREADEAEVLVYPNPTTKGETVFIKALGFDTYEPLNLEILNSNGVIIRSLNFDEGQDTFELPTHEIVPGMYILRIHSKERAAHFKWIVR